MRRIDIQEVARVLLTPRYHEMRLHAAQAVLSLEDDSDQLSGLQSHHISLGVEMKRS